MIRDLDLIRKILLEVESWPPNVSARNVDVEGYSAPAITYHALLLHEAGYIKGAVFGDPLYGKVINPTQLTWDGHEFLDEARDKTVWEKAKKVAAKAGASSFSIFRPILTKVAAAEVERALSNWNG
ncbi:MAG: DUF2513 domain-containing protein [Phormidesmis sp.]